MARGDGAVVVRGRFGKAKAKPKRARGHTQRDGAKFKLYDLSKDIVLERQEEILEEVRAALFITQTPWRQIAASADLSPATISKFAYKPEHGGTKRPSFATVLAILTTLGYDVRILSVRGRVMPKVKVRRPSNLHAIATLRRG